MSSQYIEPINSSLSSSNNITTPSTTSHTTLPMSAISSYVPETSVETFDLYGNKNTNNEMQQKLTEQVKKMCGEEEPLYTQMLNYMKDKPLSELVEPSGRLSKDVLDFANKCLEANKKQQKPSHMVSRGMHHFNNEPEPYIDVFADVNEYLIPLNDQNKDTVPFPVSRMLPEISDYDAIGINSIEKLSSNVYNNFMEKDAYYNELVDLVGEEFAKQLLENLYNDYIDWITGKNINEIIDENGFLIIPDFPYIMTVGNISPRIQEILRLKLNNIIQAMTEKAFIAPIENLDGSKTLPTYITNFEIVEVVRNDSGYDAIVLQDKDGNYRICSSQTNPKSQGDLSIIAYSLLNYLFDENIAKYMYRLIVPTDSTDDVLQNSQDEYFQQVNECYNLILKYTKEAEKTGNTVDLSGFSLGGGITATAYGLFVEKQPGLSVHIDSVDLYNPFLLFIDSYYLNNVNPSDIINNITDNEKLTIYSAEGDFVSTLNDYHEELKEHTVFVQANDITSDIQENKGENTGANLKPTISNIKELYDIIISSGGNHGIAAIDNSCFDENGNIAIEGEYQNINELIGDVTKVEYNDGDSTVPNLTFLLKALFQNILVINPEDAAAKYTGIEGIDFTNIINYICEKPRTFKTSEFLQIASETIKNWLNTDEAKNFISSFKQEDNELLNYLLTYVQDNPEDIELIIDTIINLLQDEKNFHITMNIIMALLQGDKEAAIQQLIYDLLVPNLSELLSTNKDLLITMLPDIIATEEMENLIKDTIKDKTGLGFIGTFVVWSDFHTQIAEDFTYLLENYPDIIPKISECIAKNGFDIEKILYVIDDYLHIWQTPGLSLLVFCFKGYKTIDFLISAGVVPILPTTATNTIASNVVNSISPE